MADQHDHGHAGHAHGVSADADRGKLAIALALILGFMAVEVVVGILAGSLALLSDAAHMLTDAGAIGLALVGDPARRAPGRRGDDLRAQARRDPLRAGQRRDAARPRPAHRLRGDPPADRAADRRGRRSCSRSRSLGVVVNLAATWTLSRANRESLNVEGAFQHILTDLAAFVATAIAGVVILPTGFDRADGIASLIVAAIMLRAAYGLLRRVGPRLPRGGPAGPRPRGDRPRDGRCRRAWSEVHDLHVWEVTSGFPALSAHVLVGAERRLPRASAWRSSTLLASASRSTTRRFRSTTSSRRAASGRGRVRLRAVIEQLVSRIEERFTALEREMSDPDVIADRDRYAAVGREYSELEPAHELAGRWRTLNDDLEGARELLADGEDEELRRVVAEAPAQLEALAEEIRLAMVERDPNDDKNVLVEIRAGAGGDEAALFAGDLYKMLTRYAEERGFGTEVISQSPAEVGGFKDVTFAVKGDGAYSVFKYEGGTHRVQRVPKTESQGRIHTSTATVAVLPEAEDVDVEIDPNDLQIDVYRSSGPGGQSVNTTDSAVRITHAAERDRRLDAGREVAAPEPRQGDAGAARAPARARRSPTSRPRSRPSGARRSGPASAPRRSAPTTSRRAGSPTTGSS